MGEELTTDKAEAEESPSRRNYWVAGGVALAVMAIAGSYFASSGETNWSADQTGVDTSRAALAEDVVQDEPEPEPVPNLEARGVVAAKDESTIASRMTARITSLPVGEGRSFRRGALLAKFDCSSIRAELAAAQAATKAYRKTYETNVELDSYEAVGRNEVEVAEANLGRAQAEASAISAQLKDCAVYAPFSGTVVEAIANRGEVAASGQPLMRIQSGGNLEAELIVPSNWLTWLDIGAGFDFVIDETGVTIPGTVSRLGASVDPVSKTIRITADIEKGEALVLPGMSGTAIFDDPENIAEKTGDTQGGSLPVEAETDGRSAT